MSFHCLITGTTCGIGLHLAEFALSRGAVVVSIGHSGLSRPNQCFERDLDVTDEDALSKFMATLPISRLDLVINNAGIFPDADIGLADLSVRDLLYAFDVNAVGPLRVVRSALPLLKRSERPTIMNVSSTMGLLIPGFLPGSYAYRMSKAALNMLTFCLVEEFPWITTFSVHPGHVRTAMGGERASVAPEVCASSLWRLAIEPPASGQFMDLSADYGASLDDAEDA